MIVVDTNALVYLILGGEKTEAVRAVYGRHPLWSAPLLWRSEFRNVLRHHLMKGHLSLPDAIEVARLAESLMKGREYAVDSASVLSLASGSKLSAYDCEFVALARDLGTRLVTSDAEILAAFPAIAVSPEAFAD